MVGQEKQVEERDSLPAMTPDTRPATLDEFIGDENASPPEQTGSAIITDVEYHEASVPWYDYAVITFSFRDETTVQRRFSLYSDGSVDEELAALLDYLDVDNENPYTATHETKGSRVPAFSDGQRWSVFIPCVGASVFPHDAFSTALFKGTQGGPKIATWLPFAATGLGVAVASLTMLTLGVTATAMILPFFLAVISLLAVYALNPLPGTVF